MKRKVFVVAGAAATIAVLGVLPSGVSAASDYKECDPVAGETDGVEWGGTVEAKNIKCGNAERVVKDCIKKGELKQTWTVAINDKGVLKFRKSDKRIKSQLAGGEPPGLKSCFAPPPE